jgi:outer membrane receptor for ferrienterochelin and colicin
VALLGQTTTSLAGRVLDPAGNPLPQATLTLEQPVTRFRVQVETTATGTFTIPNIPVPQDYSLTVTREGFAPLRRGLALRSPITPDLELALALSAVNTEVVVAAFETAELVDVAATGTRTALSVASTESLPIPVGNRGLEAVLLSFPGFAQNANGAIHPRGAHNQMTWVLDGLPISDQLTGSFASSLDPNLVQTIELFTGNIPAEYGAKVSGVASIITRSGQGSGRQLGGSFQAAAAQFDTLNKVTQLWGEQGKFAWFGSLFALKTNRFLDAVSLDNLHNGGNNQRGYARLDYRPSIHDSVRLHFMGGRSSFELANSRSQQANGQDQRQLLYDAAVWSGWTRVLNPRTTLDATVAYRTNTVELLPSAGDTPVTAAQWRRLTNYTVTANYNTVLAAHTLRGGVFYQRIPLREQFTFGITDPRFNDPGSEEYNPALAAHDLSRGGSLFSFAARGAGQLAAAHIQDTWRLDRWVLSLGLRYDSYRFLVNGAQWQPRVGVSYHLRETGTVLRASYNRNYQTPPNENLLLSSSEQLGLLAPPAVREALGETVVRIRPERQNVYEVGLQQVLWQRFSLNATYYHKNSRDQQDNDNFLNTGIIFPITLSQIRVNGAEFRLNVPEFRRLSGSLSVTHAKAVSTPPFTGGLFLGASAIDALSEGPFVIDHDQRLSVQANLIYKAKRGWWASTTVRHDSGLVANPSNPAAVAADPDFADLLPLVDLNADPARVRPRTVVDAALGYERSRDGKRAWDIQIQTTNLTDRRALFNFQSVFVGTRLLAPRSIGLRFRVFF